MPGATANLPSSENRAPARTGEGLGPFGATGGHFSSSSNKTTHTASVTGKNPAFQPIDPGNKYARRHGTNAFTRMGKQEIIEKDLREFYNNADGGIYRKYLPDFEQAVVESGY